MAGSAVYVLVAFAAAAALGAAAAPKQGSAFLPADLRELALRRIASDPAAAAARDRIVAAAEPWRRMTDEALWDLVFGPTITRSWMVWSNGHCPACLKGVPMYNWRIDAFADPWKVRCPHCEQRFPTNDFGAFYRSGLDARGIFDPASADRSLLFNADHPAADDPLRTFGVDDGDGFVQDGHRWRFIGAYLIYGAWKQQIVAGVVRMSAAYVLTGDPIWAHKAGVLLDRVADVYPGFDMATQGQVYEVRGNNGYVSNWHDACEETRQLVLGYDAVFDGLRRDAELVRFLAGKARKHGMANPKTAWADVERNITEGLLLDPLKNKHRIHSNFPRSEVTQATIKATMGWPANRAEVLADLDPVIARATAVDGTTGEKGLAGYTAYDLGGLADMLARLARMDAGFLPDVLRRHPALRQTWRFHIDTWVAGLYYPQVGDTGTFGKRSARYVGVAMDHAPGLGPSMETFLWQLSRATGDPAYLQVVAHWRDGDLAGVPGDLFARDAAAVRRDVADALRRVGPVPKVGSVNKPGYCLALLRSGPGPGDRVAWMSYDAGGPHGHRNGMNLGMFAYGLDVLPEFGYPPVQFGGWGSPRARWFTSTAAHNTVIVDRQEQAPSKGATTLWADGPQVRAVRAASPQMVGGTQYERTLVSVEGQRGSGYLVDVFRVAGGSEHVRLLHSGFGTLTLTGASPRPAWEWGGGAQIRALAEDSAPQSGWAAEWALEDRWGYLREGAHPVLLRCTDLTEGASALTAEAWVAFGYEDNSEAWVPLIGARRAAAAGSAGPLSSTFVAVVEAHRGAPFAASARRLPVAAAATLATTAAAIEVRLADGSRDLVLAANPDDPAWQTDRTVAQADWRVTTDADLCVVRCRPDGTVSRVSLCGATRLAVGDLRIELAARAAHIEAEVTASVVRVVAGDAAVAVRAWRGSRALRALPARRR